MDPHSSGASDTGFDQPSCRSAGPLVVAEVVAPGTSSFRVRPLISVALFGLGVALPLTLAVYVFTQRRDLVGLALNRRFLGVAVVVAAIGVVARIVGIVLAARRSDVCRSSSTKAAAIGVVLVALLAVPVGYVAVRADQLRRVVGDVFADTGSAAPLYPGPAVATPAIGASAASPTPEFTNILLLGGDEGPGRWGLRTDSMILVTIHRASGRVSLVSIPRNLVHLQFPPDSKMAELFPNGFDDLANAVYPYVYTHPDVQSAYTGTGADPEAVALAQGVGYSLGVRIDDYALVNMQGFLDLVDSLGGIDVTLDTALPLPGNVPGAKHALPATLGPGAAHLDGTLALAFVRSRSADSDYQRMGRQRQLLTALGGQVDVAHLIGSFGSIAGSLSKTLRTSMSVQEFSDLADTLRTSAISESVGLVPPQVTPGKPDFVVIRDIVAAVQARLAVG